MPDTELLVTLALSLIAATVGGAIAVRLGQSAILGFVIAGLIIGPYTPGAVADVETVAALADIGLVFLLFAVGLELSIGDLFRAGRVALLGGTLQVVSLVALGYVAATAMGFTSIEALFFGAFISQSSSAVMAKILAERAQLDSAHGLVALGWATLQDLSTIVLVVLLTGITAGGELGADVLLALGNAALFMAIILPLGRYVLPFLLERVATLRSRELFILAVVAIALGTAYLSEFFGLSLALGAFVAGLLVSESDISHHALGELEPVRDIFAALFFVSVGMLIDPAFVLSALALVLIAVLLVVAAKGLAIAGFGRLFGLPGRTAVLAGVALAQSGEFSFLLARIGVESGDVGQQMFSLMLASAGVSIAISPSLTAWAPRVLRRIDMRRGASGPPAGDADAAPGTDVPRRYAVICGYGRVGRLVAAALERRGFPYVVIEVDPRICRELRKRGLTVIQGLAENPRNLDRADLGRAQVVVVTVTDQLATRLVVHHVRNAFPRLTIVARARAEVDREALAKEGVSEIVLPETEAALEIARFTLTRLGVSAAETQAIVSGLRRRSGAG